MRVYSGPLDGSHRGYLRMNVYCLLDIIAHERPDPEDVHPQPNSLFLTCASRGVQSDQALKWQKMRHTRLAPTPRCADLRALSPHTCAASESLLPLPTVVKFQHVLCLRPSSWLYDLVVRFHRHARRLLVAQSSTSTTSSTVCCTNGCAVTHTSPACALPVFCSSSIYYCASTVSGLL